MALTTSQAKLIADALQASLTNARIRSIRQDADDRASLLLECRLPGKNLWLLLKTSAPTPRAQILSEKRPAPQTPSGFVMALRKYIEGLLILGVDSENGATRIRFALGFHDEITHFLVLDTARNHENVYLLDAYKKVRAAASNVRAQKSGVEFGTELPTFHIVSDAAKTTDWPSTPEDLWRHLEAHFEAAEHAWRLQSAKTGLLKRIRQALKRNQRAVLNIEGDLQRAENADELRHEADLLQSVRGQVKRGQTTVEVFDWNHPTGEKRAIQLDPSRSLADEIERRYKTYRRLRAAEDRILARLEQVEEASKILHEALHEVETSQELETILRHRQRLESKKLIPRIDESERVQAMARLPYREAKSSDGYRILIGRGSKDNDTLTFKIARGRDIWLHARESSGSHVIIVRPREAPVPERTMLEAANLAAYWSSAKNDTRVDVGWTERKHVSKPSGAAPGRVSVASMRNLLVTPDADLAHQLVANARAFDER